MLHTNISVGENGHLYFGGQDTVALAQQYGTPLYVMDEVRIRENMRMYRQAFRQHFGEAALPLYASKACSFKQMYRIAAEEGLCPNAADFCRADFGMPEVGLLCGDTSAENAFAHHVNDLLLERSAKLTACSLAAIILYKAPAPGSRICICSDGTTIAKNPLLRPLSEKYIAELLAPHGLCAEYFQVSDATLLGSAYAGLL